MWLRKESLLRFDPYIITLASDIDIGLNKKGYNLYFIKLIGIQE